MTEQEVAKVLIQDFDDFRSGFDNATREAKLRFEKMQWPEQRLAMQQRITLHEKAIDSSVASLRPYASFDSLNWKQVSTFFVASFKSSEWFPLSISYYNSVLRQAYNFRSIPYLISLPSLSGYSDSPHLYLVEGNLVNIIINVLEDFNFQVPFRNLTGEALQITDRIEKSVHSPIESLVMNKNLFYRNKHAYAIGQVKTRDLVYPLALAIVNTEVGVSVKAALINEDDIKNIFAFSRSYFLVNSPSPAGTLNFLLAAMPSKPKAQLLINIGYQEFGKELLLQQLNIEIHLSDQKFDYAPGIPGMVMLVFCSPGGHSVFKVVRENIKPPKNTSEQEVIEKHRFVAQHDRVGRMADVQHFKNLALPADCFEQSLKMDLLQNASQSVRLENNFLVFTNIFIERKLIPLNLYLLNHDENDNVNMILDYGASIKEMVMTNIFPGDLLLKNFGMTDEGKVVFYDYDEVVALSDCNFKKLRVTRHDDEEYESEYSEPVRENDVFPEELVTFLVPKGRLREEFLKIHSDLFSVEFWNHWKDFHLKGAFLDLQPYSLNIN